MLFSFLWAAVLCPLRLSGEFLQGKGFPHTWVILLHHYIHFFCLFLTTKLKKISFSCTQFQSLWSCLKVSSGIFFFCYKFIFISAGEFRVLDLQRRPENNYVYEYESSYSLLFSFLGEPFSFGLQKCRVTVYGDTNMVWHFLKPLPQSTNIT